MSFSNQAVDSVGLGMESVGAEFVLNQEEDQDATRHPDGQSQDVDGRMHFVPEQIPNRDEEIISPHGRQPFRNTGIKRRLGVLLRALCF